MEIINGTIPVFAQWNYRISCHPLSRDVPLNRFRMVNEFHSRLPVRRKYEEQTNTRAARFQLSPRDHDIWDERFAPYFTLLDKLMGEIPGKDNYQGNLTDEAFDLPAYTIDPEKLGKVNAAYYHRTFKVQARGAMGQSRRYRGFADQNIFVAMTTQPRVAGVKLNTCKGPKRNPICKSITQKFSYAIPLEIIYLTPLNRWNPFDLEYKGTETTAHGKTVFQGGRTGGADVNKAYNGTNSKKYYQTPLKFFSGQEVSTDAADTTQSSGGVLNRNGDVKITRASGIRIFFPPIKGSRSFATALSHNACTRRRERCMEGTGSNERSSHEFTNVFLHVPRAAVGSWCLSLGTSSQYEFTRTENRCRCYDWSHYFSYVMLQSSRHTVMTVIYASFLCHSV